MTVEKTHASGTYAIQCHGPRDECRDAYNKIMSRIVMGDLGDGADAALMLEQKWERPAFNIITTQGKNHLLDNGLGSSLFLGLISAASFTATSAGDTAAQINGLNGWKEAGAANAPTYSGSRPAVTFSAAAAGSKAFASSVVITFTGIGTVKGAFLCTSPTKDGVTGVLFSAGLSSGGDDLVKAGDFITVTYVASLT